MKHLLSILLGASLLAACSSDEGVAPADADGRVPLRIVAGIEPQVEGATRAVETAWEAGDAIGVYMTIHNLTTPFTSDNREAKNLQYTFDDGTNYETSGNTYRLFTPQSGKMYLTEQSVDVYGYYPYDDAADLDPTAIPVDVSVQTSQKAIDFMRARTGNVNNNNASIELMFHHRLTKLVFNLRQGEGLLEKELNDATYLGVTIDHQSVSATYNIYSDAIIVAPDNKVINTVRATAAPTGYVRTFEAIVLPNGPSNPATPRTVTITFYRKSDDTIVNTFTIGSGTYFNAGYKYVYNVTVNATSIQVDTQKYTEQW